MISAAGGMESVPHRVRRWSWKGGNIREKEPPKYKMGSKKGQGCLCAQVWDSQLSTAPALGLRDGRREPEAGSEFWPDQRLNPSTAKGKGFLEFGTWEVHLEGFRSKKMLSRAIFIHLRPVPSLKLYSYVLIFGLKRLKMPCLRFPQYIGALVLQQWSLLLETLRQFKIYSRSSRMDSPFSMPFPK